MILPTMNDEEKFFNAARITPMAMDVHKRCIEEIGRKFAKGNRFPYFQRVVFEDDRKNTWWLTYMVKSKSDKKKGRMYTFCYTIYEIQKKKEDGSSKYDGNTGKGVLLFDPIAMNEKLNEENVKGMVAVNDIIPHAFNRYTQRYLKPKGKENIEFQRKVESMMARWGHFDVDGDVSSNKHGDYPYDVFMNGGGMLRGQLETNNLIRFYTYVDGDMMFDNQIERQDEMRREYYEWLRKGMFDANNKH